MASFMTDLWQAVFEAGPTPTLLIATNATFAALQLVLFALLLATYSVHFVILSILCAGLWASINWFAAELVAVRNKELAATDRANSAANTAHQPATASEHAAVDARSSASNVLSSSDNTGRQRIKQQSVDHNIDHEREQVDP